MGGTMANDPREAGFNSVAPPARYPQSDAYQQFTKANQPGLYFGDHTAPMLALEAMVDAVGLRNVLFALKHIAEAKADHVAENWQGTGEGPQVKAWNADARA